MGRLVRLGRLCLSNKVRDKLLSQETRAAYITLYLPSVQHLTHKSFMID